MHRGYVICAAFSRQPLFILMNVTPLLLFVLHLTIFTPLLKNGHFQRVPFANNSKGNLLKNEQMVLFHAKISQF